jgi:tRNA wybutosine-synthesizing protein 1
MVGSQEITLSNRQIYTGMYSLVSEMEDSARQTLARQGYHLVGSGAVKPCLWLNRSLRGGDQCYKHHFYGISSHRCVQMTPTMICNQLCLHCWRPIEIPFDDPAAPMEPEELLEGVLFEQQRILSGYGGSQTTDLSRLEEARKPAHVAISLMGEPTLYPYLRELVEEISRRDMTSFLVTNGTRPEVVEAVRPTQLYVSLNATDQELYRQVSNPRGDYWSKICESLSILRDHQSRTVIRLTLALGVNMREPGEYARLLEMAEPDFIEAKAYMHLGRSRARLKREAMPSHAEIMSFSMELCEALGYGLVDAVPLSRVALLSGGRKPKMIDM